MLRSIALVLASIFISMPALAGKKKVCNDLKASQCKKREDCSWIKKSKKTDRKAYCRSKGKKAKSSKK